MKLSLGIDIGSSSTKAAALDEHGRSAWYASGSRG